MLTQRLRRLERDGLVARTYHPEVPPRVEYEISELGRSLAPLFATLAEWSVNLGEVERARLDYDAPGSQSAAIAQHRGEAFTAERPVDDLDGAGQRTRRGPSWR